jgi:carboxyl-terminal processing protease
MMLRQRILATILIVGLAPAAYADVPRSGNAAFDRTVDLVMQNFYDPAALGRFEETVRETIASLPPAKASANPDVYDPAIARILASLDASHTGRFNADELAYYELADIFRYNFRGELRRLFPPEGKITYPGIGIATAVISGKTFVSDVYDGAAADKAGIEVGDEILSVDGTPFAEIASFRGKVGESVKLALRRKADGTPMTLDVPVAQLQPSETLVEAISNSAEIVEHNGKKIGYLRVWFFAGGDVEETLEHALAGPLAGADALVLDLRGRWGGAPPDAAEIILGGTPPFRFIGRDGEGRVSNVRWRKPVVAIIDEGTRSGLEVFAFALKAKGIPLVGTKTAGALLGGRGYLLPDATLLEIAVAGVEVDGVKLEGVGVAPDIAIPFDLRYASGADPQRDRAVKEAAEVLRAKEPSAG